MTEARSDADSDSKQALPDFSRGVPQSGTSGVLPCIAQEAVTGRVLMFAWMDTAAFAATMAEGYAVYFSRSRSRLWRKGETSGHRQRVLRIEIDCDADAILLHVEQTGAACHEGYKSCFFRTIGADGEIKIDEPRIVNPDDVYGT
jgi:phosphoribosyl-AMP cyclohydrolase